MIQIIGLMIGAYICTRMVENLSHAEGKRDTALVIFSVGTLLGTMLGILVLLVLPTPAALR